MKHRQTQWKIFGTAPDGKCYHLATAFSEGIANLIVATLVAYYDEVHCK